MWYSFSDKYEIVKRNDSSHPKKIKSAFLVGVILCACFVVSTYYFTSRVEAYPIIQRIVYFASIVALLLIGGLKYLRNGHELDVSLIFILIILVTVFSII